MTKNTHHNAKAPVTTADLPPEDSKFTVIAEAVASDAKRIKAAGNRMSSLVDEVALNVHLAYSTGYVITERMAKADLPAGSIRQNDYVALFQNKGDDDDAKGPSVTTIKRWRRCGAALAAGIDRKDPVYRALKSGNTAASLANVLDTATPDEAKIRKAHAALVKAEAKAIEAKANAADTDDGDEDEDSTADKRAAQVSTHEATSTEMIEVLLSVVTALKVDSLTPAEYEAARGAYDVLGAKFDAYDEMAKTA